MKSLIGTPLKRFLKQYRRQNPPRHQIVALLQSVEYPTNVGSIFRLADGAGISHLILTGITPIPPNKNLEKAARHKNKNVPWSYEEDPLPVLKQLKKEGFHLLAIELTDNATPYHQYQYPEKTCLIVGHEDHGITKATLAHCDNAVFLPMYGKGLSLNVHVALSIVTYHILHP